VSVLPDSDTVTEHHPAAISRSCYRCFLPFLTASTQRRVYCPVCVQDWDCPSPVEPVGPVGVPTRRRCEVCGGRVRKGTGRCPGRCCADQLPLLSAQIDRRRKEWRDEG